MEKLPSILPVFRVRSTILMPRAQLPIVVHESDSFDMAGEAIENNIVGVIQPKPILSKRNDEAFSTSSDFRSGCAGRITDVQFHENEIAMNILGICRFDVIKEEMSVGGIERVQVSYDKYKIDLDEHPEEFDLDREKLISILDGYFKSLDISPNWKEIENTPSDVLISALAMACPFHPSEKQSILETVGMEERTDMIMKIIEINSFDRSHAVNTVN